MLSQADIDAFTLDGFVAIRAAIPPEVIAGCQDDVWAVLAGHGIRLGEPATWRHPVIRLPCPQSDAFAAAGSQPTLWEAYDQLIGEGRWLRQRGVGGSIPVRFPSAEDPGDAGWHIEASYEKDGDWRVSYRSRARGLLALYLLTDVDPDSAPTRIRAGSHRDAAQVLATAGEEGMPWMAAAQATAAASVGRPATLACGQAGDVYLCHPFLVHAASWPHTGQSPRMIAQPGVLLHDAFPLTAPLSPVERAMGLAPRPDENLTRSRGAGASSGRKGPRSGARQAVPL